MRSIPRQLLKSQIIDQFDTAFRGSLDQRHDGGLAYMPEAQMYAVVQVWLARIIFDRLTRELQDQLREER